MKELAHKAALVDRIRQFISPPVFPEDADKTRTAANLFLMLRVEVMGILFIIIARLGYMPVYTRISLIVTILVFLHLMYVGKRGYISAAAFLNVLFLWSVMMTSSIDAGGVQSMGYVGGGMVSVLLAGFLLQRRHIITLFLLTLAVGVFLVWLQLNGKLPWIRVDVIPVSRLVTYSVFLLMTSLLAYISVRSIHKALDDARQQLSEREKTEAALRESEERFRLISSVTSDYTFSATITPEGRVENLRLTGAFEAISGYKPEEFDTIGGWRTTLHPDHFDQDVQNMALLGQNQRVVAELRIIKKGGEIRWVRIYTHPIWSDEENRLIGMNGGVQDITERKRLEAELQEYANKLEKLVDERTDALRRANEQLELVLNNTTNALAFADANGDLLVTNPAFRATFLEPETQRSTQRSTQRMELIIWRLGSEEQIALVSAALLKVIYDRESQQIEVQIVTTDGQTKDVDLALIPVMMTNDETRSGVLLSGHDITQLKEIERFKARFVADAVHDLATPISALSSRLYLLQRSPEKLTDHVRALEHQVEHLRGLLNDLRTLSRLDRGQMSPNLTLCSLNEIVQRVFDTYEPVALEKRQTLTLHTDPTLPALLIDQHQIERVVVNLVSNAVNYTAENKAIHIETTVEGQKVLFRVIDQGIGISSTDLPRIFDRFYRTDTARVTVATGTGLGLAITKEIVEMHGGSVMVASEPGQGSTFTVCLPLPTE